MRLTTVRSAPDAPMALKTLLHALAVEIETVAVGCRDLENLVSEAALGDGGASESLITRLQAFDVVLQTLAGMKGVLSCLAEDAPPAWVSADRVLDAVPLAALARRLSGVEATIEPGIPKVEIW